MLKAGLVSILPVTESKDSFAHLLTSIEFNGDTPLEIIEGHHLRRANEEEIEYIKNRLSTFAGPMSIFHIYEFEHKKDSSGRIVTDSMIQQERKFWRYWVVSFNTSKNQITSLNTAFSLLEPEIEFGFQRLNASGTTGKALALTSLSWQPGKIEAFIEDNCYFVRSPVTITTHTLGNAKLIFYDVVKHEAEQSRVYKILQDFEMLRRLPRRHRFTTFGYFTVLESLITHDPSRSGDSLSRQIRTKMSLLCKRFSKPLDGSEFGIGMDVPEIWGLLYKYRSHIAHGVEPDFSKEPLRAFGDEVTATLFVKAAAKRLLLFAMKDPSLVADLREC